MPRIHTITLNPVIDLIFEVGQFEKGTTFRSEEYNMIPAGKGLNASNALACLDEPSHSYALIGAKDLDLFADICSKRNIQCHAFSGNFQTRRHCTILESQVGSTTHVQIKGEKVPLEPLRDLIEDFSKTIKPGDWAAFSGSVPPGIHDSIYADMIVLCKSRGVKTLLDASGEPLRQGAAAAPDLIKLNQTEAEELTGMPVHDKNDALTAIQIIREQFDIPLIAISLGEEGLAVGLEDDVLHLVIPMSEAEVKDIVGCGDAMVGGILYGIIREAGTETLFRYAIACASAAALHSGPSRFKRSDMENMLSRLEVSSCSIY